MKVGEWAWSAGGEHYGDTFVSRDECIADARAECTAGSELPRTVFVARVERVFSLPQLLWNALDMSALEESAADLLFEESGCDDAADRISFPSVAASYALDRKLQAAIFQWAREHGLAQPVYYRVGDAEEVELW